MDTDPLLVNGLQRIVRAAVEPGIPGRAVVGEDTGHSKAPHPEIQDIAQPAFRLEAQVLEGIEFRVRVGAGQHDRVVRHPTQDLLRLAVPLVLRAGLARVLPVARALCREPDVHVRPLEGLGHGAAPVVPIQLGQELLLG